MKISKIQKNQKDKNSKKIEKHKKVPLMKTWQTGIMVAKKDFCQEGENLVNRRLLHFMLHLAAHLLAFHAVFFRALLLSCFSFASLMYPWITS